MILTVTPNPALDMTWELDRIVPGGSHRAAAATVRAGGKGVNVARILHAEGYPSRALVTAGGASGAEFADELRASGVPARIVPVAGATRRSVAWVDRSLGDATIVNERGEPLDESEWNGFLAAAVEELHRASVLVVSGSVPPGAPERIIPALIAAAREAGLPTIVDTSGPALLRAAEAGAAVLKPNRAELIEATGLADPLAGAAEMLRRGAGLVLLSLGAEGMRVITARGVLSARLPHPLRGNPTGAGDAAVAACAALLSDGVRDPETILRRAVAWSAAAVLMPFAGDIHRSWREGEGRIVVGAGVVGSSALGSPDSGFPRLGSEGSPPFGSEKDPS